MKVAMENVILIVCPQGFAPLTSQRHTTQMLGVMICFSFYLFFFSFVSSTSTYPILAALLMVC